jgi:hypothetical protein
LGSTEQELGILMDRRHDEICRCFKNNRKNERINPLYSYLSIAKGVNVRWVLGCKAVNPDLATPKIGSFYFPNFEEELYRQDYS